MMQLLIYFDLLSQQIAEIQTTLPGFIQLNTGVKDVDKNDQ